MIIPKVIVNITWNDVNVKNGESCTIKELQRMYWQVKRQAAHTLDVPKILVAQYGFIRLPYDESVQVTFVVDTDTDRIYARTY